MGIKLNKWRPPNLSELTLVILNMELTHLGSEASICIYNHFIGIKFSEIEVKKY